MRSLALLAAALTPFALAAPARAACPNPTAWANAALEGVVPQAPELELGVAGDALIGPLLSQVCAPDVTAWIPGTCAPFSSGGLRELRARAIGDVAMLPERRLAALGLTPADPRYTTTVSAALALRAAVDAWDTPTFARQLVQLATPDASGPDLCRPGIPLPEPVAGAPELVATATVIARALQDEQAIFDALKAFARQNELGPSDLQKQSATALVASVRRLEESRQATAASRGATRARAALDIARAFGTCITLALTIVRDAPAEDLSAAFQILSALDALARGDLLAALDALPPDVVSPETVAALRQVIDLVTHPPKVEKPPEDAGDAAKEVAREFIHRTFPWTRPFMFDVSGGIPSLRTEGIRISGSLLLGYNGDTWGIVGNGDLSFYDYQSASVLSDTIREGGSIDGWLTFGSEIFRLELRGNFEASIYDTETINLAGTPGNALSQETSAMYRGSFLGAARLTPNEDIAAGLWVGAGFQYESYDPLHVTSMGVDTKQQDKTSLLLSSRLRLQALLIRRWLAARARADLKYFGITRDALALGVTRAGIGLAQTSVESKQLEIATRAFLDLELARLWTFVPGLTAGFDYVNLKATGTLGRSTFVPMFGAGIRSESF